MIPVFCASRFDTDGSNAIDHEELREALKQLGKNASEDDAKRMIARVDHDGTGEIDFDKFCQLIGPIIASKLKAGVIDAHSGEAEIQKALNDTFDTTGGRDISRVRSMIKQERLIINPNGKYMRYWDPITMYALVFVAIVTPAEIVSAITPGRPISHRHRQSPDTSPVDSVLSRPQAFTDSDSMDWLFWSNRTFDAIFLKDLIMQFFLAYPDPKQGNRLVKDRKRIVHIYLHGWFGIDAISLIPFDIFGLVRLLYGLFSYGIARCPN